MDRQGPARTNQNAGITGYLGQLRRGALPFEQIGAVQNGLALEQQAVHPPQHALRMHPAGDHSLVWAMPCPLWLARGLFDPAIGFLGANDEL
jgi:hypothetical protein